MTREEIKVVRKTIFDNPTALSQGRILSLCAFAVRCLDAMEGLMEHKQEPEEKFFQTCKCDENDLRIIAAIIAESKGEAKCIG